jgi:hypothetical protein
LSCAFFGLSNAFILNGNFYFIVLVLRLLLSRICFLLLLCLRAVVHPHRFFTQLKRRVTGHVGSGEIDLNLALVERHHKGLSLRTSKLHAFVAPDKVCAKEWEHRLGDWQELFLHQVETTDRRANAKKRTLGAKHVAASAFFK